MSERNNVGQKISSIRKQKNISIEELSERCGFSTEMMDQIEKNETIPSLGHLIKVARALGVRLGTFLDDMERLGPVVSRKEEVRPGTSFSTKNSKSRENLNFYPLAGDKSGRHMEPFIIDISPSTAPYTGQSSHEGEEFIYVLAGKVEISYGKEVYTLSEGDSIYYDSVVEHHVHTASDAPARILAVVYAPF
jgi:transcriptional regulator with XRE-family HTH domain